MKSIHKNILLLLFSASLLLPLSIKAQEEETSSPNDRVFKPFKVGFGLFTGAAFAGSSSSEVDGDKEKLFAVRGFSVLYIEPKYAITDNIGVGFRMEAFLIGGGTVEKNGIESSVDFKLSGLGVYSLTGDYTFTTTVVRPSLGLGLGLYNQKGVEIKADGTQTDTDVVDPLKDRTAFGISPRAQVNLGSFVLGLTYHLTFDEEVYDFFSFNVGVEFGGGRY